jgi:hypothetical protein
MNCLSTIGDAVERIALHSHDRLVFTPFGLAFALNRWGMFTTPDLAKHMESIDAPIDDSRTESLQPMIVTTTAGIRVTIKRVHAHGGSSIQASFNVGQDDPDCNVTISRLEYLILKLVYELNPCHYQLYPAVIAKLLIDKGYSLTGTDISRRIGILTKLHQALHPEQHPTIHTIIDTTRDIGVLDQSVIDSIDRLIDSAAAAK